MTQIIAPTPEILMRELFNQFRRILSVPEEFKGWNNDWRALAGYDNEALCFRAMCVGLTEVCCWVGVFSGCTTSEQLQIVHRITDPGLLDDPEMAIRLFEMWSKESHSTPTKAAYDAAIECYRIGAGELKPGQGKHSIGVTG